MRRDRVLLSAARASVRALRGDGHGEHVIEVLPDGRIRVELPNGVAAVYRRAGS